MRITEVTTKDGSITFHNPEVDETYHSSSGAAEESFEKFARPCRIDSFDRVRILDVCFGIGYNSAAALDLFKGTRISITAIENDQAIIDRIQSLDPPFSSYHKIKDLAVDLHYKDETSDILLIIDDALQVVKRLPGSAVDVVFFDPFSPKKAPHMWTLDFFRDIFCLCSPGATLATYSCARSVRDNLRAAGFQVRDGPSVGRRSPSTIGTKPF